jgi:SAM-dependent methyltransferase
MDEKTLTYYSENAAVLFERYLDAKEGIAAYFDKAFEPGCSVLDIGCGSGRDMIQLIQNGFDAYGLEPCSEFIKLAINKFPNQIKSFSGRFAVIGGRFCLKKSPYFFSGKQDGQS